MTRVLVVDDMEENCYLLRALLEGFGYEVETACQGAEALALARLRPPDLVVSDLLMPIMDGYTLLRRWKSDERLRRAPFIVYTATYTEPKDEQLALDLGADAFIVKPAEPEAFIARLQDVLRQVGSSPARIVVGKPTPEVLKNYSEILVRKLEEKAIQLERANASLRDTTAVLEKAQRLARLGHWVWHIERNQVEWSRSDVRDFRRPSRHAQRRSRRAHRSDHPPGRSRRRRGGQPGGRRVQVAAAARVPRRLARWHRAHDLSRSGRTGVRRRRPAGTPERHRPGHHRAETGGIGAAPFGGRTRPVTPRAVEPPGRPEARRCRGPAAQRGTRTARPGSHGTARGNEPGPRRVFLLRVPRPAGAAARCRRLRADPRGGLRHEARRRRPASLRGRERERP